MNEIILSQSLNTTTGSMQQTSELENTNEELEIHRFELCVIVHGTKLSGKSTVSKYIAEKLRNVPIIDLKELWKDIQSDAGTDYIYAFSALISQQEYSKGFVIDCLNCFDEKDNSEFLQKAIKTKGAFDDLFKNPFTVFEWTQRSTRFSCCS